MQERETGIKKRRKGGTSSTSNTQTITPEGDVYKVCHMHFPIIYNCLISVIHQVFTYVNKNVRLWCSD